MNGGPEQGEPTPGPIEDARSIYAEYAAAAANDKHSSQETEELLAGKEDREESAISYAELCASLGFCERTVGFLEHTTMSEADRLTLLAQAEERAAKNALGIALSMTQRRGERYAEGARIVKSLEAGARRTRAKTLRQGARMMK